MATARKTPQDHRPASAAEDVTGPVPVTVTYHDHKYTVPADAFDDVEFLDAMMNADAGDKTAPFRAARALLGNAIWDEFRVNERGENGRVTITNFMEFFETVMDEANRKNS